MTPKQQLPNARRARQSSDGCFVRRGDGRAHALSRGRSRGWAWGEGGSVIDPNDAHDEFRRISDADDAPSEADARDTIRCSSPNDSPADPSDSQTDSWSRLRHESRGLAIGSQ